MRGEPLPKEAWEAIMDEAFKPWESYYGTYGGGTCEKTDNRIDIQTDWRYFFMAPPQEVFADMLTPLFDTITAYASYISKVHLPYLDYVPADGQPTNKELFMGLFDLERNWEYNLDFDAAMINGETHKFRFTFEDSAGSVYTIEWAADTLD